MILNQIILLFFLYDIFLITNKIGIAKSRAIDKLIGEENVEGVKSTEKFPI